MRYRQAFALTLTLALLMGLAGPGQAQKALKIFMIPKFTGAAYFAATEKGAKDAVAELKGRGVAIDFLYTGPSVANTDEEIRMIDDLVAQKPDAIIIAANHADALVPVVTKAKTSGIKVITYDADVADPTARQWFVNQGTFTLVGTALVDVVAEQAGASARFAVVSTDPGAFSQNSWIAAMKAQMQAKYPKMQLVNIRYGLGKPAESFSVAQDLINKFRGQLDAIVAPTVVALPKVAEAVEQTGFTGKIVVTPFEFNSSLAKLGVKEKLAAEELIDQWVVQFLSGQSTSFDPKRFKTVEQAILDYLDEKRGPLDQKKESTKLTIRKIAGILKPLTPFLSDRGVVYMKDVKTEHLTALSLDET